MTSLVHDLRYAWRLLVKSPGFTAAAVITLALGIGANTAIFTLLNGLLLKSLPVRDPAGIWLAGRGRNCCVNGGVQEYFDLFPYPLYVAVRRQKDLFSDVAAFTVLNSTVRFRAGITAPISAQGKLVSANYFAVLGVNARLGRFFRPEEESSPEAVTVVSYRFWQGVLHGDPGVVGQIVNVNGQAFTVVGVAPPQFFGETIQTDPADLWFPLSMAPVVMARSNLLPATTTYWLYLIGRLAPGVSPDQASSRLTQQARDWMREYEKEDRDEIDRSTVQLTSAAGGVSRLARRYREPLRILMFTVAMVLLIACANVANLFLARAAGREREIATRVALGASRPRLVRQLLTESMTIAFLGGGAGLVLAFWGTKALIAMAFRGAAYVPISASPDLRVLAFLALVSVAVGLLFGVAPAWKASHLDIFGKLHPGGSTSGAGFRGFTLGKLLVVVQIASCLTLVVGALLFTRSFLRLQLQDFGFERDAVLDVRFDIDGTSYTLEQFPAVSDRLLRAVETAPGVSSASLSFYTPFSGDNSMWSLQVSGYTSSERAFGRWNRVSPGFFNTMGMRLLAGRDISYRDGPSSPHVAVVSEAFVRKYFAGRNPLGQTFRFINTPQPAPEQYEIVGVVSDMKYQAAREEVVPTFYVPLMQLTPLDRGETRTSRLYAHDMVVRSAGDAAATAEQVRAALRKAEPDMPVGSILTMGERINRSLVQDQTMTSLSIAFGALALVLACVGLYGLMAYAVARRTREFGIRMALGAPPRSVLALVLGEGMRLVGIGLAIGVPIAWGSIRLAASQFYGIEARDPRSIAAAAAVLALIAALAGYIPARRATKVDPMIALRYE
jgi:macrolide transport system ATP-binding/permease protein